MAKEVSIITTRCPLLTLELAPLDFKRSSRANPATPVLTQDNGVDKRGAQTFNVLHWTVPTKLSTLGKTSSPNWHTNKPVQESTKRNSVHSFLFTIGGLTGLLFLLCAVVKTFLLLKHRKPPTASDCKAPVSYCCSTGTVTARYSSTDNTEFQPVSRLLVL